MDVDLFAGVPVSDYAAGLAWVSTLLGQEPSFFPNDREAVWEVAPHRFVYIVLMPEHAGHAVHTLFVDDLASREAQARSGGLEPSTADTYDNGVRKLAYRDQDGNELSFAGQTG